MTSTDYHASAAWAAGNRAARRGAEVHALREALAGAEAEIQAWREAYIEDVARLRCTQRKTT